MEPALAVDLPARSRQLVYFRLAFSVLALIFGLLVTHYLQLDIPPAPLITVCALVSAGNLASLLIMQLFRTSRLSIQWLNAVLLLLDLCAITEFVHLTRGIESDLFFLYLLPILLASHIFERRGVFVTALAASVAYPALLIWENWSIFSYLFRDTGEGLTAAYAHRTYLQIASRSGILFGIALVWAAFCDRMSRMVRDSLIKLGEQLQANNKLLEEVRARGQREQLTNSISLALRTTLDLEQILITACTRLAEAVHNRRCIFVTLLDVESACTVWDSAQMGGNNLPAVSNAITEFLFAHDWKREVMATESRFKKFIISDEPFKQSDFDTIRDELREAGVATILIRPIMYMAAVRGVLVIFTYNRPELWRASELELVDSVAGQLAVAVEHAQLVEQLSHSNQDLVQKNANLDAKNLELREVQSHLIHQEKMASLGRMVAGIAHELNNPVNFVHGNLPYLKEYCDQLIELVDIAARSERAESNQLFDELKKKANYEFLVTDLADILTDITEGTERVRQIIRNLRSFSRLDEAELKEASLQEGIESTLKILCQYYAQDKIPVETHFCQLPPVLCYPGKLNQVWMNLLSNAAHAVSSIPSPRVVIETELENDFVTVLIADNGTGIKDVDQSKIFEPFFTTKPVGQGTGLGLSICHSIIEQHGGTIRFETTLGQGTKFLVRIPLRASIDQAEEARIEQAVAETVDIAGAE